MGGIDMTIVGAITQVACVVIEKEGLAFQGRIHGDGFVQIAVADEEAKIEVAVVTALESLGVAVVEGEEDLAEAVAAVPLVKAIEGGTVGRIEDLDRAFEVFDVLGGAEVLAEDDVVVLVFPLDERMHFVGIEIPVL